MDGRVDMAFGNRGASSVSGGSGTGSAGGAFGAVAAQTSGEPTPQVAKADSNLTASSQSANLTGGSGGGSGGGAVDSAAHDEHPPHNSHDSVNVAVASPATPGNSSKRKRGRPRKFVPDGTNMTLALSPLSATASSGTFASSKRLRGRPPGSGWKQKLAPHGEWMNSSAGLAFTPHVLVIGTSEDIAAKILSFAQQRSRVLCILSATGLVSAVTLRQHVSSGVAVTYEGCLEILSLSGSYLLDEAGGPRARTGGISISVSSPDGQIIGGAVGGRLIAASPVQVVACSFVYGGKPKIKSLATVKGQKSSGEPAEKSTMPETTAPNQEQSEDPAIADRTEIDLTQG